MTAKQLRKRMSEMLLLQALAALYTIFNVWFNLCFPLCNKGNFERCRKPVKFSYFFHIQKSHKWFLQLRLVAIIIIVTFSNSQQRQFWAQTYCYSTMKKVSPLVQACHRALHYSRAKSARKSLYSEVPSVKVRCSTRIIHFAMPSIRSHKHSR